jgi:predicted O-methyltransferase YrrM
MTVAPLLTRLLQAHAASRVLVIGADDTTALVAMATMLPEEGRLLALDIAADRVATARAALAAACVDHRASVMHGDALRFLHKVAGPFDLAVLFAPPALRPAAPAGAPPLQARVRRLVPPPGIIVWVDRVNGCLQPLTEDTAGHRP